MELAYRLTGLGLQFFFNPQAIGYHYAERSYSAWVETPFAYGQNDVILTYKKGHSWLLPQVWREFHTRHILTRMLAYVCLGRPTLSKPLLGLLKQASIVGQGLGWEAVSYGACSGIFNLRHYEGVAAQLGGRRAFFAGVAHVTSEASRLQPEVGQPWPVSIKDKPER